MDGACDWRNINRPMRFPFGNIVSLKCEKKSMNVDLLETWMFSHVCDRTENL